MRNPPEGGYINFWRYRAKLCRLLAQFTNVGDAEVMKVAANEVPNEHKN